MANSDKDIRVVPNRNKSGLPYIAFTGYNNDPIILNVLDDNTISFEGSSGQLFSVSNAVTTGTIFSVNDISGIPSFRIDADGTVGIAEFSGNVGIGLQSPQSKLSVGGDINVGAGYTFRVAGTKVLDSSSLGTGVTQSSLTSLGTINSGTWQGTAIGVNYGGTGATNASDARSFLGAATAGTNSDITRLLGVQHLFVTIPTAAAIGITVKAATSQSASMMEFVNSSNSLLAWITKDGTFAHGAYFTHNDGRIPGISVQRSNAAGIVARGFNSDAFPAIEVQNNPGSLTVGLYPSGLVYGGVLQAYASTASTNTTTGALIVAGGAGIAGTTNFGRDVRIFSSLASSSPFTGSLVVSGGVGISNNLFVGGGVAFTSSIASTSTSTGTLVVTGGVGIGGSVFTSTSNASSISGVVLSDGSVTLTGTYTQSNSSTTAFQVRDGSNNTAFNIDTIGDIISLPIAIASTSTSSGSLVVAGGVGIGGTLNANSVITYNKLQNQSFSGSSLGTTDGRSNNYGVLSGHDRISYGNGVFVTNSSWGAYNSAYSTDGINWTASSLPVNRGYPVSMFGNGYFVLVATGATNVMYSTNGISWSQVSIGNTFSRTDGVYGNGKYVVVGTGETYNYSTNITSWTSGTLPLTGNWRIAYGNGVFVALGYNSRKIIYSYDGIYWNIANTKVQYAINWTGLKYANGRFIASAYSGGGSAYSLDGINWFSAVGTAGENLEKISYGNGVYFVSSTGNYYTSGDGTTYNNGTPWSVMYEAGNTAYGLGKFQAIGRWIDGPTNTVTIEPKFTGEINNVRIGAITPASGDFTNLSSTGSANLVGTVNAYDLNIISKVSQSPVLGGFAGTTGWTSSGLLAGSNSNYALAFGNGLFVQIRRSTDYTSYSPDGRQWVASNMPFSGSWIDVAWGKDKFVAVSSTGASGAYSGNGITWTSMNMPSNTSGWYAVTYGDEKFVAVGNGATVAYSSNGISWTGAAIADTNWTGIAYGNGTFVAVSGNGSSSAYSYDGLNWNYSTVGGVNNGIKFITYGNGYFIVTNYVSTAINYSRDGINWSTSTRTSSYSIHTDLAYGNGVYSIFNYQEASYSYDAINWLNGNTIAATDWQAVAYGNNRFVATSINTSQVGSIDGPSNTLNLYPKFTGDIDNVRIGAKEPAAAEFTNLAAQQPVRFTSNTPSTNSTNGALVVVGGVGIGGSVYSTGLFNFGTLQAPAMSSISGFGTGGLSPSTTYYYKLSAIDYNNNESLPSPEYSVTTGASQYGIRFYISTSPGASGYKLYRTTTSGNYTDSYVQTYRTYQQLNAVFRYDVGKPTSAGSPLSRATGNNVTLGYSTNVPANVLPSLTIPSGSLQVKSPNVSGFASPSGIQAAIETGPLDYLAIRDTFGFNGISASTGGTLTPGQTYYYVATMVDHYGNESLPTDELAITADAGGAVLISFNVASVQIPAIRVYRSTTPGNYTNCYIGELPGNKDIGYPTMSGSPPTTTSFAGVRLNPRADFFAMSYIPNIDLAPSHRNGYLRKLDVPYTGAIAVTTSGIAGSLLPNTTYYYKCAAFDIFGNSAYPTAEVSVSTGTSTAVTISGGGGLIYAKVYRSTVKNNYSNVPTYYVSSFPFTDRGDATFADTPSGQSRYIQSQLFCNESNQVPQNYLRDLSVGPILNNFPFNILAPLTGLNSVTASTGGTLVADQVYYYLMEAVDIYGNVSSGREPIRFVATAGGAANVTQYSVGSYGYVSWNLFRTTNLANWSNTLIATGIKGNNFIDIGYPTRTGGPTFGFHRPRNVIFDNAGTFHIPLLANQYLGQNLTSTSTPYRTGGNSAGSLTTNTTYYYRVIPYGGANQSYGYASDEFQYTTGANERNISMTIGGHKIGAMYYRVFRSTTFNNFTNAYYFETPHINFTDYGHTTLQGTADFYINSYPRNNTVNILHQGSGNYLAYTTITGQSGGLKIHLKSPIISSISSGTGGTLSTNTDYWYKVEAIDVYGIRTFVSDEAYINTASNNSVTLTWNDVPGAYYYRVYRATASQTFANKLIASYVNARTFTDLNYPTTTGTPVTIFENAQNGNTAALFQMDNSRAFGVMPRTVITNIDNTESTWYTDFSLRITSPPVGSASAALLQVGAGFTNFSSAGFNGTTYGTQIAIGAAIGFTGSLLDAQTAGVSRFRINFDGSSNIGSTTGSGSTSTGALVISGGVGIGQSLFTSASYSSSISGAIFSNGSATIPGTFTQNNSSTTAFQVRDASNNPAFVIDTIGDIITLPVAVASTSTGTGSLVVAGGVGIGGTINIAGNATIGGTLNVSGSNSYFQNNLYVGNATQGRLYFSQATLGSAGTTVIPSMAFIGATNSPITLSVLPDNSLSFDGSSGQLFSINNNLSTGWIFAINDISGLPIFRTNADLTVAMGEYGGNVGIGLSNPTFKLQVSGNAGISGTTLISNTTGSSSSTSGALVVSGGVGIGGSLFTATGNTSSISGVTFYNNRAQNGFTVNAASSYSFNIQDPANNQRLNYHADSNRTEFTGNNAVHEIRLIHSNNSAYTGFKSNSSGTVTYILPPGDGTAGQVLYTNGAAGLAWTTQSGGSSSVNAGLIYEIAHYASAGSSVSGSSSFTNDTSAGKVSITHTTASTSSSSGSLVVSGGLGIGGTAFIAGNARIQSSTASTNSATGALQVAGGVGISGQLSFNQAAMGQTGILTNPSIAFIGTTGSPITMTVLSDNSLSWEGTSGQLFSIDNNLTTGEIFAVSDISGLPIISAYANQNISMGEFGGNVAIGISNPAYKLHVSGSVGFTSGTASTNTTTGALIVTGGVAIGSTVNVGGRLNIWNGSNYTGFASTASGNIVYILPATSPATGSSVLQSNSAGVMTWVPMTSGSATPGGTADGSVQYKSGSSFGATTSFLYDSSTLELELVGFPAETTSGTSAALKIEGVSNSFNGSVNGTMLAINAPASFTGDLLNVQFNSVTKFKVTASGGVGLSGSLAVPSYVNTGNGSFTKNLGNGDIALDNGTADTPASLYYWQNNKNFGTDVYFSGTGVTRYRIVKELNESGGSELWSVDRDGIVYRSAWAVGETIKTSMYNYSDLGMSATTTISSTSYTTIATISYTPSSSSSYLWIEFSCTYDIAGGGADDFWSNIEVNSSEIVNAHQIWANGAGGGTRSGVMFPLSGRYTNSATSSLTINVRVKRGTSDDNGIIYGNSASGFMRIQEIGR